MNKNILVSAIATATFLIFFFSIAQKKSGIPRTKPTNPHLQIALDQYQQVLEKALAQHRPPGAAIAIVKDSTVLLVKGFGKKSISKADSIDAQTLFRIGSLSKGFAAVLCGLLVEDQELALTDKVVKHLPNFALHSNQQTAAIEIKHLLSHTTGLPYHTFTNLVEHGSSIEQIMPQLKSVKLISKEGEVYSYQNAAFSLIEPILESVSEQSFSQLLDQRIFTPLHMNRTSYTYEAIRRDSNLALPHSRTGSGWVAGQVSQKYYNSIPAGGINASISDMAQWMIALLGHRPEVIPPKSLDRIFSPVVHTPNRHRYFRNWTKLQEAYYAMGWRFLDYAGHSIIHHGGFVNNYRSEIAIDRKSGIGICILTNGPSQLPNNAIPLFLDTYLQHADSIQHWDQQQVAMPSAR